MFGDHAFFIVPAYIISALVFCILIVWLRLQYSSRRKELAALEQSGVKRRSDTTKSFQ